MTTFIKDSILLAAILLSSLAFFLFAQISHAQQATTTPSEAIVLARVNVQNCLLAQEGRGLTIDCDFINNGSIQSGIKYAVLLISEEDGKQSIVDQKVYDEVLTLKEGEKLHKTISYPVPPYVDGTVSVWIKASNQDGLPLAQNRIGLTTHTATGDTATLSDCYITLAGDTTNTKYNLTEGIDIKPTEQLLAHCTIKNQGANFLTLAPVFNTFKRNLFGERVDTLKIENAPMIIPPGLSAPYTFGLPHPDAPQAYDTAVTLMHDNQIVSNQVAFHYVIAGASATIQTLSLDKISYTQGQTAVVTTTFTGSADDFPDSRLGGTNSSVLFINTTIYSGDTLCGELVQPAGTSTSIYNLSLNVPLTADCPYPAVTVKLLGIDNQLLAQRTLTTATPPAAETTTTTSTNLMKYLLYGLGGIVLILIIAALYFFIKKRRNTPPTPPEGYTTPMAMLFLPLLLAGSVFMMPGEVRGDTFSNSTGNTWTADLDKTDYSPGETMLVTGQGAYIWGGCGNYGNPLPDLIQTTTATNIPTGESYEFYADDTTPYVYVYTHNFTAPSTPGNNHRMHFLGTGSYGVTYESATYDMYYNVIGSTPTATLTSSPSTITAGNSSTLTYSCGNSASGSIDNGVGGLAPLANGTKTVSPSNTTTYTLTCTNSTGQSTQAQTTVTVTQPVVNGLCGTANNTTVSSAPSGGSLCSTGSATAVSGSGPWTWGCNGSGGGSSVNNCSAAVTATPVNGSCNNAIQNSCTFGNSDPNNPADTSTHYRWSCNGINGGNSDTSCSFAIPAAVATCSDGIQNQGETGVDTGGPCATDTCSQYSGDVAVTGATSGGVWGSGPYTRDSNIGVAAVHAGLISSGQSATIRKTSAGTVSAFTGTTANGVTTSSWGSYCGVNLTLVSASVVNGQCGSTNNTCAYGNSSDRPDTGTTYEWSCNGSGGGTSDTSCSAAIPPGPSPVSFSCTVNPASVTTGGTATYTATGPNTADYYWRPSDAVPNTAACGSEPPFPDPFTIEAWMTYNAARNTYTTCIATANAAFWPNLRTTYGANSTASRTFSTNGTYGMTAIYSSPTQSGSAVCPNVTVASTPPTATITATNCTIAQGQNSCTTNVSWTSANTTAPVSIRQNNTEFSTSANNGGGTTRTLPYGTNTFTFLHNGGTELTRRDIIASCPGSAPWNGTACMAIPDLTITTDRQIVRSGDQATITWNVTNPTGITCSVTGPGVNIPTATLPTSSVQTPAVTAKSEYELRCTDGTTVWKQTTVVETTGTIEET